MYEITTNVGYFLFLCIRRRFVCTQSNNDFFFFFFRQKEQLLSALNEFILVSLD